MTTGDILGLILSYLLAFGMLLIVEAIRRWRNYPTEFTRKLVHIGFRLPRFDFVCMTRVS